MIVIRPKNEAHAISEWFYDNTARDLKFILGEIYVCVYVYIYTHTLVELLGCSVDWLS